MPDTFGLIIGSGFSRFVTGSDAATSANHFGMPSSAISNGKINGSAVLMLERHGKDHTIPPHAINYRANLLALKQSGVSHIVALNTVGVISDVCESGELAVPRQILDYTWGRAHTIFDGDDGQVEHIDFSEPFSPAVRERLLAAAGSADIRCHDGGVYATTQGPRLESAAEIDRVERDGADFVGMTAMPEAALAREMQLEYACLSLIVNRAAGRGDRPIHDDVEASTASAREKAEAVLRQFFGAMAS